MEWCDFCVCFPSLSMFSRFIHMYQFIPSYGWNYPAAAKSPQSCPTLCDPMDSSPLDSSVPGILQNTGGGCHFLLQCMKVKSESEVAQSCPTLSDPMDFSPPGSSVHGTFQARVPEWGAIAFSETILLYAISHFIYPFIHYWTFG